MIHWRVVENACVKNRKQTFIGVRDAHPDKTKFYSIRFYLELNYILKNNTSCTPQS